MANLELLVLLPSLSQVLGHQAWLVVLFFLLKDTLIITQWLDYIMLSNKTYDSIYSRITLIIALG